MKTTAWILLFINIGLLVYFNLDRILPNSPAIKWAEISPEKISLLTEAQISKLPKIIKPAPQAVPAPIVTPPVSACFEWGTFSLASVSKVKLALEKLSIEPIINEHNAQTKKRFWVFVPPAKSAETAQKLVSEYSTLGIDDMFIVQTPKWKNAISFGLFEDETLAQSLLSTLKAKGIKNAQKSLWKQEKGDATLLLNQLSSLQVSSLKNLEVDFPEANLKKVACK